MPVNFIKQRAGAQFKKLPGVEADKPVMSEHEAAADARDAKTARLKELRLARDAAALAAPPTPAAPKKKKKTSKKKKRTERSPALSLSDWLKNRHAGGHTT
jgi:hypothetical protein